MKFLLQTFFKGLYYFLTDSKFRYFVYLSIRYGSAKRYMPKKINVEGCRFSVPDARSFIWQYYEIFFKRYYRFETGSKKPLIIDCGANVGMSIFNFKQQYPGAEIHGFEADAEVFGLLRSNLAGFEGNGMHLMNKAVWIKNEKLNFISEGADGGKIVTSGSGAGSSVDAIDLREYLMPFEHIDFLKIDIEGAEHKLLPHIADQLHKVDCIFLEYHSYAGQEQNLASVISAVCSAGHRLYIDQAGFKNQPFIKGKVKSDMDLQLNIFAFKS